jgi:hypothetical protein
MCCQCCCEPAAWQPGPWGVCPQPWYGCVPVPVYYPPCCPACGRPAGACCCQKTRVLLWPQELAADPTQTTATRIVGGVAEASLVLEYLPPNPPGSPDPEVTVELTGDAGTSTTAIKPVPAGFHVKDDFGQVSPGTKLTLTVKNCYARLRWCERVEY